MPIVHTEQGKKMNLSVDLGYTEQEIEKYWKKIPNWVWYLAAATGGSLNALTEAWWIGLIGGLAIAVFLAKKMSSPLKDGDVDRLWHTAAKARENEAYRVANYDEEDAIRDAIYFFGYAEQTAPGKTRRTKEGKDKLYRRNHQKLVYMIFGRDQLIVFDETICLENKWDGADQTEEFYWDDVSSVSFDEKSDSFQLTVGPRIVTYPLTGENDDGHSAYSEQAQEVSNAVRMILRERKSSRSS